MISDTDSVCECVCVCVCFCLLTVWGDCLYGLALASDVPYGQSPIWVTANELLALVMPGNWVDRLGNDRQEAGAVGGVSGSAGWNIMCHHLPFAYKFAALPQPYGKQYNVHMWVKCPWFCIRYSWTDGESEIKESDPWLLSSLLWHKCIY